MYFPRPPFHGAVKPMPPFASFGVYNLSAAVVIAIGIEAASSNKMLEGIYQRARSISDSVNVKT